MVPARRGDGRNMLRPYGLTRTYPSQPYGPLTRVGFSAGSRERRVTRLLTTG